MRSAIQAMLRTRGPGCTVAELQDEALQAFEDGLLAKEADIRHKLRNNMERVKEVERELVSFRRDMALTSGSKKLGTRTAPPFTTSHTHDGAGYDIVIHPSAQNPLFPLLTKNADDARTPPTHHLPTSSPALEHLRRRIEAQSERYTEAERRRKEAKVGKGV